MWPAHTVPRAGPGFEKYKPALAAVPEALLPAGIFLLVSLGKPPGP